MTEKELEARVKKLEERIIRLERAFSTNLHPHDLRYADYVETEAIEALLSDTPTAPAECCRASLREWHDGVCNTCGRPLDACPYAADHDPDGSAECVCGAQASGDIVGGFGSDDPTPTAPACSHPALLWDPAAQVIRCGTVGCSAAWGLPSGLTPTAPAAVPVERLRVVAAGTVTGLLRERIVSLCDEAERNAKGGDGE